MHLKCRETWKRNYAHAVWNTSLLCVLCVCVRIASEWGGGGEALMYNTNVASSCTIKKVFLLTFFALVGSCRSGGVGSARLLFRSLLSTLHSISALILTEALLNAVKQPVHGHTIYVPFMGKLIFLTWNATNKIKWRTCLDWYGVPNHTNEVRDYGITCGFTGNKVSALIHLELSRVGASILLTQPLNLFTLHSRESRHTHRTAFQDWTLIFLCIQFGVMENTVGGGGERRILKGFLVPPSLLVHKSSEKRCCEGIREGRLFSLKITRVFE